MFCSLYLEHYLPRSGSLHGLLLNFFQVSSEILLYQSFLPEPLYLNLQPVSATITQYPLLSFIFPHNTYRHLIYCRTFCLIVIFFPAVKVKLSSFLFCNWGHIPNVRNNVWQRVGTEQICIEWRNEWIIIFKWYYNKKGNKKE